MEKTMIYHIVMITPISGRQGSRKEAMFKKKIQNLKELFVRCKTKHHWEIQIWIEILWRKSSTGNKRV